MKPSTAAAIAALVLLVAASAAHASGSATIGPFVSSGDGEYNAAVTATFRPDDPAWPWDVIAYSQPPGRPCTIGAGSTVFVSDSMTGPGTVQDQITIVPEDRTPTLICLYLDYHGVSSLLTQSTFTPPSTPSSSARNERIPTLTQSRAWGYVATVLDRRFSDSWSNRAGGWIKCGRINRLRMRCRVAWAIGDTSYYGLTRIWYARGRSGAANWYYSYRIHGLDEYCASVTHAGNCSHLYVQD